MNALKKQSGWILFGVAVICGVALLWSAPRSINVTERAHTSHPGRSDAGGDTFRPALTGGSSFDRFRSSIDQNPFRPPERWSTMVPQDPPKPPLPDLTLPEPVFLLPVPPSQGKRWSPLVTEIEIPANLESPSLSELNEIASGIGSAKKSGGDNHLFDRKIKIYDRVYLNEQEEWVKGKITEESEHFITFRFLSSGKIKRFNVDTVRVEKAENPVESFRSSLKKRNEISDQSELDKLVEQALELGLPLEAAELIEDFARNQRTSQPLYRRAAKLYRRGGEPNKAIDVLQTAIRGNNVKKHELLFLIARNQWEIGLKQRAVATLQKSMDLRPLFLKARLLRFLYLFDLGKPSETAEELNKLRSETSGMSLDTPERKLYKFAEILYRWGYETRSMSEVSPQNLPAPSDASDAYSFAWPRAITLRSRLHLAKGDARKAMSTLVNGLNQYSDSYPLWYNLGVIGIVLDQDELTSLCFSTCDQLAPYRFEHRIARGSAGDGAKQLDAVLSNDHTFLLSYHKALNSLNNDANSDASGSTGATESPDTDSSLSPDDNNSGSSSDDSSTASGDDSQNGTTADDASGGESGEDGESVTDAATGDAGESGMDGSPEERLSGLERFKQVYRENQSFVPGALGLAYKMIEEENVGDALSLLRYQVHDSWLKHYLLSYCLSLKGEHEAALDYLRNQAGTPESSANKAHERALLAYLLLQLERTERAVETIDSAPGGETVTTYMNDLKNLIEKSRKRRVLEDSFEERPGSEDDTFLGMGWTSSPGNAGVSIRRKPGQLVLSGTLGSAYAFPHVSRPTNEQFISLEFTGRAPSAPDDLIVGAGLLDTSGGGAEPMLLVGFNPNDPRNNLFVTSGSFSSLDDWTKFRRSPGSSSSEESPENTAFSIRISRDDTSGDASWSAEINDQSINLDRFAPGQFNGSDRAVLFFVTGPEGTSTGVRLDRFRLVHELNE